MLISLLKDVYFIAGMTGKESRLLKAAKNQNRVQDYYEGSFPCDVSCKVY